MSFYIHQAFIPLYRYSIQSPLSLNIMEDEYAKLIKRMNPPRVTIDNSCSPDATVIQVESANEHALLLQVVQLLSDFNLLIKKAYISSDAGWFMDVFNVTHPDGSKVKDERVLNYIQNAIYPSLNGFNQSEDYTSIEFVGPDRPGLLSEVSAVLTSLGCNVVNAEVWTHNATAAAVVHVTDEKTNFAVQDPKRLSTINNLLSNVVRGNNDFKTVKMTLSTPGYMHMHRQRRLHQIMFAERDYDKADKTEEEKQSGLKTQVTVFDCAEKDYTVITMRCRDRPKLLFDIICTLTDMQYVVFHGVVHTGNMEAFQEYYIRHVDGSPVSSEAEREHVMQCLVAAIERRMSEALELELRTADRVGLLSDITRIFRENSLCIKRAEISTEGGTAKDKFYVTDMTGNNPVDPKTIDSIQTQIGQQAELHARWNSSQAPSPSPSPPQETAMSFLFGSLFKCRFQTLKLVGSYSRYS